jgi:hypothetical protein
MFPFFFPQSIDRCEHEAFIWDLADRLRHENNYSFEVTPLFISIAFAARGDIPEARDLIKQGKFRKQI